MNSSVPFVLPDDVIVAPISELDDNVSGRLGAVEGSHVVWRPNSRTRMKVVGPEAAELLEIFRTPCTAVNAVIHFCAQREANPESVLIESFPLIRELAAAGLLAPEGSNAAKPIRAGASSGESYGGYEAASLIKLDVDTEVHFARSRSGEHGVLKLTRLAGSAACTSIVEHEIAVLRHLDGRIGPKILTHGTHAGRRYLVAEWLDGVRAEEAAAEFLQRSDERSRQKLLQLCLEVVEAYERLHDLGVIHADVHPGNALVCADGSVRIIDFALSRLMGDGESIEPLTRGGADRYLDPEYARALYRHETVPRASAQGEQYSIAAVVYKLLTGNHYLEIPPRHDVLLERITTAEPRAFLDHGLRPWPKVEDALKCALSKDPAERFASVKEFREALQYAVKPNRKPRGRKSARIPSSYVRLVLTALGSHRVLEAVVQTPPTASVSRGAAGIAYGLYRIACIREDPQALALSDVWLTKALSDLNKEQAFYNPETGFSRRKVRKTSLYHHAPGVHIVRAMLGHAVGEQAEVDAAVSSFVASSKAQRAAPELLMGRSGTLLGCSLLRQVTKSGTESARLLRRFGDETARKLIAAIRRCGAVEVYSQPLNLGMAHGWAGVLYSVLRWTGEGNAEIPTVVIDRLEQLAALAEPSGRGVHWPWVNPGAQLGSSVEYMPGWCNGSAGFVHLWTLAYSCLQEERFRNLAKAAAWNAWEDRAALSGLCCGLAGRAYALLRFYRLSGNSAWLERAATLGIRAAEPGVKSGAQVDSLGLYDGEVGPAVLLADLAHPEEAFMPFFEGAFCA